MSTFNLSQRIRNVNGAPNLDFYYGVWSSKTEAILEIPQNIRSLGRTVGILEGSKVVEYWWQEGTSDQDLVEKGTEIDLSQYLTSTQINSLLEDYYNKTEVDNLISAIPIPDETTLEEDVTAQIGSGNIQVGDLLNEGMTFTQFVKAQFLATFEPTAVAPTYSLSINGLTANTTYEIGTSLTINMTGNFNRGRINGALNVSGIWNPNALQAPRAGEASSYVFEGNTENQNTFTLNNYIVQGGINSFSSSVNYQQGAQPINSDGDPSTTLSALPAGSLSSTNTRVRGAYKNFYGAVNAIPSTSSSIRALPNNFTSSGTFGNLTNNQILVSTTIFVIALPPGRNLSNVRDLETNANLTGQFSSSSISVEDAGNNTVNYTLYTFQTLQPLNNLIEITIS